MPGKRFDNCPASSSGYLFAEPDEDEYRSISERLLSRKTRLANCALGLNFLAADFRRGSFRHVGITCGILLGGP